MGWSDSSFHQSFEARHHLDPQSPGSDGSGAEYTWCIDETLAPSLENDSSVITVQQNQTINREYYSELVDELLQPYSFFGSIRYCNVLHLTN